MGTCFSSMSGENDMDFQDGGQIEKSRMIDKEIRKNEKVIMREVKILLLGAGESGKTTILKVLSNHALTTSVDKIANATLAYEWFQHN